MSESTQVIIESVAESTYGVTPTDSPNWETLRFVSDSLNGQVNVKQSQESRQDRNISDQFITSIDTNGGINGELTVGTYDAFLEMFLGGTWASDVLKIGTTKRSRSIVKRYADLTGYKGFVLRGMRGNVLDLGFSFGNEVTIGMSFAGADYEVLSASLVGTGSVAAANTNPVINASGQLSNLEVDNVASNICVRDMTIRVDNQLRAINCVGSNFASEQNTGRAMVTGNISMYLDDEAWQFMSHSLNQSAFSLDWMVSNAPGGYDFSLPNLRISGNLPPRPGPDSDVMFEGSYTALYDETAASSLVITRSIVG